MLAVDAIGLGRKVMESCPEREVTVETEVEGKQIDFDLSLPVMKLAFGSGLSIDANVPSQHDLKTWLNRDDRYTMLKGDDKRRKQIDAFVTKTVEERQLWVRDGLLAAGLLEPAYTVLGHGGIAKSSKENFAEHLAKSHSLFVFDTNVFMRHIFSNYLKLRLTTMGTTNTATVPAAIWELEDIANRDDPEQARLARSAFRDVVSMQSSTKYQVIESQSIEMPSDRLIRQQVRGFKWSGTEWKEPGEVVTFGTEAKVFVTFDRVSALAAQAEGMACTSLDVPVGGPTWSVKPVRSQKMEEMIGAFLSELAIARGVITIKNEDVTMRVSGDWAGKSSLEWIEGKVRLE
jgi:hypothetical protein